ncbi:MAG TPA: flap endonuclease-1 [Methanocorpusculum sp.]|nr:flap endonuclease-1 [Methanocorpusculum sp.]
MGVAIRQLIADYIKNPGWNGICGTAAIDAFNALYQFLSSIRQTDGTPLMDKEGRVTSHLNGILFRTANLAEKNITPIFIFDGKPPQFKRVTLQKRRIIRENATDAWEKAAKEGDEEESRKYARATSKVDTYIAESSKELLTALGIPWILAPEEGEAQSAYMVQNGDVTYAVSQDYDSLLFGTADLVRNITVSGRKKVHGRVLSVFPERIKLEDVLSGLGITREELIQTALLVGTDYNSGVNRVGPKTAVKIVKQGMFDERIIESENAAEPDVLINYFMNPPVCKDYVIKSKSPDRDKVLELLCEEHGFAKERVESGLEKLGYMKGQSTLDSWF